MKILETFINFKTFMAVGRLAAGSKAIKLQNSQNRMCPFYENKFFRMNTTFHFPFCKAVQWSAVVMVTRVLGPELYSYSLQTFFKRACCSIICLALKLRPKNSFWTSIFLVTKIFWQKILNPTQKLFLFSNVGGGSFTESKMDDDTKFHNRIF